MSLPASLKRWRAQRGRGLAAVVALVATTLALLPAAPADAAGLDNGLCTPDNSRASIPSDLPLNACFDGQTLVLENPLTFPVEVQTDNGGTPVVAPMPNASVPGSIVSMMLPAGDGLTPPNYKLSIPISDQQTTVTLTTAPDTEVEAYTWGEYLYDALGANDVIKIGQALASLVGELATVTENYRTCLLNSSWLGKIGCLAGYTGNITFALARFGVKALTPGLIEAAYNVITTALQANDAAGQVSAWTNGTRQFTIAAAQQAPAPPPSTTEAPAPPPTTEAPTTAAPPPPAGTTPAPPPSTAPAPPPGVVGFHIEDDYYGGTWARTDPNDGTWHTRSDPPANGAYWYPNGLGVGVDCARSAAPYIVRYADGHYQTWTWWLHVTDGKWYPAAATQEIFTDGNPGVADC